MSHNQRSKVQQPLYGASFVKIQPAGPGVKRGALPRLCACALARPHGEVLGHAHMRAYLKISEMPGNARAYVSYLILSGALVYLRISDLSI